MRDHSWKPKTAELSKLSVDSETFKHKVVKAYATLMNYSHDLLCLFHLDATNCKILLV